MPTATQLCRMAERRRFSRDLSRKSAIVYDGPLEQILKIERLHGGNYFAHYMDWDLSITWGEFGPKGGARNYGARKIVRELSD